MKAKLLVGANCYVCIEENGRRVDIKLPEGKAVINHASDLLREYALAERERAKRILEMADIAERAAAVFDGSRCND